jgi:uncharacterized OB-fold protein
MHEAMNARRRGPEAEYFSWLNQGVFKIQRCDHCAKGIFYPRNLCPHCGSTALGWITPSGRGTVYSTTIVRRKEADGGDYNIVLVDLDEGVRMMGRLLDRAATGIKIGARIKARVLTEDDRGIVVFAEDEGVADGTA